VIRDAVARYATRFHRLLGGTHGVASPFGAWLLLALVAPAATGTTRSALAHVLGCDPEEAFAAASRMLHEPHAELVLGAAVWHKPAYETEPLLEFLRRLAMHADSGPIPTQSEADAWAREHTIGLIERFPLNLDPNVVLLLATAIAAKVSWSVPFVLADAESELLPADPGFAGIPLLRDSGASVWSGFARTDAGLLAGYVAPSTDGLYVMSAIGESGADPATVLDASQTLVIEIASGSRPQPTSLFEMPVGDGPAWRITEHTTTFTGSPERYEVLLPAWAAKSDHALLSGDFGFAEAGAALVDLLPPGGYPLAARQSAMARYTREGFEAAAVTGFAVATSARRSREGPVRTARVEFTRPHAVVAATAGGGDWDGLPVFSAWIAEAVPAE
jgi:Serpin (serine protease inhibitor)